MTKGDARHVIVLGIDGLRPDMVDDKIMPNLAAMRDRGVSSTDHRTVFPTETRGALTALASGARPETTGILGNDYYARDGSDRLTGTDTIHDWQAGENRIVGGMVTATNLAELLAKNDQSFAVVTSSGQGSFTALNWKGAMWNQTGFNVRYPMLAFPHELAVEIGRAHAVPPGGFDRGAEQQAVSVFTKSVWPAKKPAAAIVWLTEVDSASHRYGLGAEDMLASMRDCDTALGALLAWRDQQPERDEIAIFVTSDHGHSSISEFASVDAPLKQAGLSVDLRFDTGADILFRRGRAPGFWFRKNDLGMLQALFDTLIAQPWCGATFTRAAEPGATQGVVPGTLALELTGAAHDRAPDLYMNFKGDNANNDHGIPGRTVCDVGSYTGIPLGGGSHGGLHATELAAVLVGEGAGLKQGGQAIASRTGIYDIAPTILALLGIAPAASMTGRSMSELLETGEAVATPEVTEFTATANGKVSLIRVGHVGAHAYVDEADLRIEGDTATIPEVA